MGDDPWGMINVQVASNRSMVLITASSSRLPEPRQNRLAHSFQDNPLWPIGNNHSMPVWPLTNDGYRGATPPVVRWKNVLEPHENVRWIGLYRLAGPQPLVAFTWSDKKRSAHVV